MLAPGLKVTGVLFLNNEEQRWISDYKLAIDTPNGLKHEVQLTPSIFPVTSARILPVSEIYQNDLRHLRKQMYAAYFYSQELQAFEVFEIEAVWAIKEQMTIGYDLTLVNKKIIISGFSKVINMGCTVNLDSRFHFDGLQINLDAKNVVRCPRTAP